MKQKILFIGTILFGFLIVIICIFVIINSNRTEKTSLPISTPTPTAVSLEQLHTKPIIKYNPESQKKIIDSIKNRQTLSDKGQTARQDLVQTLGNNSGVVSQANTYILEYLSSPDTFMAQILTTDINQAKLDVNSYLFSKGFTQTDICHLPLVFYLSATTTQQLKNSPILFNALPEGCQ